MFRSPTTHPSDKLTIVGGGIVGAMEAYYAFVDAKRRGRSIRITINEKNQNVSETTASNVVPSLTPDEILSVVPRGAEFIEKLKIPFNKPGGIHVDISGIHDSFSGERFKREAFAYSKDDQGHLERTEALLNLGKMSMDAWQEFYDQADDELKKILEESNFNPCREPKTVEKSVLHDGYRIDLLYNIANAKNRADGMKKDYEKLGYNSCKILSPAEVVAMDPSLSDFCLNHSVAKGLNGSEMREWNDDTTALYRPGGCIDTKIFLPKFYDYLAKKMGTYVNEYGKTKNCFQIKYGRMVEGVVYDENLSRNEITGLQLPGKIKRNKHTYTTSNYVLAPGEAVGTLEKFGFLEPAYARFAGPSLLLNIPFDPKKLSSDQLKRFREFNHCMEVHQEGVVLAWQGRCIGDKIFVGVAGTKAFYADQIPDKNHAFTKDRNLLQLNMINDVLPEFISFALDKNTKGQKLTYHDLEFLEEKQIAKRWVGSRAVAYDGFPTIGHVYNANGRVVNMRTTEQFGSGGGSFVHGGVKASRSTLEEKASHDPITQKVITFGSSARTMFKRPIHVTPDSNTKCAEKQNEQTVRRSRL